jgi:lysophospholipase L1-like esterase
MSRRKPGIGRKLALAGALVVLGLGAAEIGVRLTGITDFPLYDADPEIGYIQKPNQSGRFLNKNDWLINEKQQNAAEWKSGGRDDILLLGDSVVWGGNPLPQKDRLGPQLQARLPGSSVWPTGAGSWAAPNEVAYMDRHPEVVSDAERLVWVFNTGDLDGRSQWASEVTHPRSRPFSALFYAWGKYVMPRLARKSPPITEPTALAPNPSIRPETVALVKQKLAALEAARPAREIFFVIYPSQDETRRLPAADAFYKRFLEVVRGLAGGDPVIEVREDSRWSTNLYRDGIHPSAKGDAVLAEILAEALQKRDRASDATRNGESSL